MRKHLNLFISMYGELLLNLFDFLLSIASCFLFFSPTDIHMPITSMTLA